MADLLAQRKWQIIFSIPLAFYFFIVLTFLSVNTEWRTRVTTPISMFWNYWRLDQNWNLFSPVIRKINHHSAAIVTLADGTKGLFELPRNTKLHLNGKFKDEMWRKWGSDSLPFPAYKEFRPDLARYIGRRLNNPIDPPVTMSLTWYLCNIPEPEGINVTEMTTQNNLPHHTIYSPIFEYRYTHEDFQ